MSEQFKQYDELSFTDDFLFCKVLENNEDLCKVFLTPDGIAEDVSEELADFLNALEETDEPTFHSPGTQRVE